jgi:hypothetical protein
VPAAELLAADDRELERRWHRTAAQLRHPGTTPESALRLVHERQQILDELERRHPRRYAVRLDRPAWPSD